MWSAIRAGSDSLSFDAYREWIDTLAVDADAFERSFAPHVVAGSLRFPDLSSYAALKLATEAFLHARIAVLGSDGADAQWRGLLGSASEGARGAHIEAPLYLALLRKEPPTPSIELSAHGEQQVALCRELIEERLSSPAFLELIWSYWHEEGMLVQSMNAISTRFQNRSSGPRDPLAHLELDPLRPLTNVLWGYIQDEPHRLSRARRNFEYEHHYGLTLGGRAVPKQAAKHPGARFPEAFQRLLERTSSFNRDDDTKSADPQAVEHALREMKQILAEGQHNQFGDLAWTARAEMLMQQWILARPEVHGFLSVQPSDGAPERWMDVVDAMKKLERWTKTPVCHFRDLAVLGEKLLLSIRVGDRGDNVEPEHAVNWARYWRPEVLRYLQAYHAVRG